MAKTVTLDASGIYYRQLNEQIREAVAAGATNIILKNVNGQRYIAGAMTGDLTFEVQGVPGQDMCSFMRGPKVRVKANAQDGVGNTMDDGTIIIEGLAGDVVGYAMRGGKIFIKGDVGYRVGIHMKAYMEKLPTIVIGGKAGDFLGEYMAGGVVIILGLTLASGESHFCNHVGTGMHGGVIFLRGELPEHQIGEGVRCV